MQVLLLVLALTLALGVCAHAEAPATAEAWLLYFASGHEEDSSAWPWWPQHQRIDQPASETGVEYTNAVITGPGYYTTALKFNWQKAEGAIQFNLIINDAEKLFPGYYCDITDIRVNGVSIEVGENLYGTYHDDTDAGMVSIYNSYWDEKWGGTGGPNGHRAWDDEESAHWLIINPDDIVDGSTIEVDFLFAEQAGVKPDGAPPLRVLSEGPQVSDVLVELTDLLETPENATTASLFYWAGGYWPVTDDVLGTSNEVTIKGEGEYTVRAQFLNQGGWTPSGNGAEKLMLVIDNGSDGQGTVMDGMYLGISEVRVNGVAIEIGHAAYGPTGYDSFANDYQIFDAADGYVILYDSWMSANQPELPWGHETWDGEDGTILVVDPALLVNVNDIEVDFFVTGQQGQLPPEPVLSYDFVWFPDNTMGVAGYSLRDMGITDKWYNVVPVNLTENGIYQIPLVASNMYMIGNAIVTVEDGNVTVDYKLHKHSPGGINMKGECVKWFASMEDITAEFCSDPQSDLAFGQAVPTAELGDVGYLFICNRVTYCQPVTCDGIYLPRYIRTQQRWKDYRAGLEAMEAALTEEAAPAAE